VVCRRALEPLKELRWLVPFLVTLETYEGRPGKKAVPIVGKEVSA